MVRNEGHDSHKALTTRIFPDKGQQIFDTSAVSYFFPNLDLTLSLMSGLEYTIPSYISDNTNADFELK